MMLRNRFRLRRIFKLCMHIANYIYYFLYNDHFLIFFISIFAALRVQNVHGVQWLERQQKFARARVGRSA